MKGSEFVAEFASKGLATWERAVEDLAARRELVTWNMLPVEVSANGHAGTFFASADYLAVGEGLDVLRIPLTPLSAQRALDLLGGFVLPTPRMVRQIWQASQAKLTPSPMVPNRGADLRQYADHSERIDGQLSTAGLSPGQVLTSGQKKDVVVGKLVAPGKVVIFGWYRPDGTFVQPRTNVHGAGYVDYSHGIRLISPTMTVDGRSMLVRDVLTDPALAPLLSDEGALRSDQTRYGGASPAGGVARGRPPIPLPPDFARIGFVYATTGTRVA